MIDRNSFTLELTCALEVKNLEQAIQWYGTVLGFELAYKMDHLGWAEIKTPLKGVTIGLSQVEEPQTRGGATLTFGVNNLDAVRASLEGQDVKFDGDSFVVDNYVKLASFFDPDGNKYMLAEMVQKS